MYDSDSRDQPGADRNPLAPAQTGVSTTLKVLVIVLAIFGGLAVIAILCMGLMHFSMMGGMGRW